MTLVYSCASVNKVLANSQVTSATTGVSVVPQSVLGDVDSKTYCVENDVSYDTFHKVTATCIVSEDEYVSSPTEFIISGNSTKCTGNGSKYVLDGAESPEKIVIGVRPDESTKPITVKVKVTNNKNSHVYMD